MAPVVRFPFLRCSWTCPKAVQHHSCECSFLPRGPFDHTSSGASPPKAFIGVRLCKYIAVFTAPAQGGRESGISRRKATSDTIDCAKSSHSAGLFFTSVQGIRPNFRPLDLPPIIQSGVSNSPPPSNPIVVQDKPCTYAFTWMTCESASAASFFSLIGNAHLIRELSPVNMAKNRYPPCDPTGCLHRKLVRTSQKPFL